MRLDHVGISAEDGPSAERFLGEVLGLPLVRHSAPGQPNQVAFYSCGNANVETLAFGDAARRARPGVEGGGG